MSIAISILVSLISIVNPLGAIPIFLGMTPDYTRSERNRTSLMTAIYFIAILMCFFWGGTYILSFFGISIDALRIAGGIVIILSAFSLLNGKFAQGRAVSKEIKEEALEKDDISFTPMAMPMLAGPGSISLLIGYYTEYEVLQERLIITAVIVMTGVIIYFILRSSPLLYRALGQSGLKAISRIMGFIVLAIGIQYIISGIVSLVVLFAQ